MVDETSAQTKFLPLGKGTDGLFTKWNLPSVIQTYQTKIEIGVICKRALYTPLVIQYPTLLHTLLEPFNFTIYTQYL